MRCECLPRRNGNLSRPDAETSLNGVEKMTRRYVGIQSKRQTSNWRRACGAILCNTFLFASMAMAQNTSTEIWPELDTYINLNDHSRVFLLTSGTRTEEQGYSDGSLGVHLDLFTTPIFKIRLQRSARRADVARNKLLQLRIGYLYSHSSKNSSKQFTEHTPTLEISPRFYFSKQILITNRVRSDFRFVDGVFTPRFRYRLKIERTMQLGRMALTPYAHAEAFYDWRYDAWHRFRYTAGAEWELSKRVVLEGYYVRQRDNRSSTKYLNAIGVALQLYFR